MRFSFKQNLLTIVYTRSMIDQEQLCNRLGQAGVLAGIAWAYRSAARRLMEDFSESAGYNATCAGVGLRALLEDRLDRVFSCGKYVVDPEQSDDSGLDLLYAELSSDEVATLPRIAAGVVSRSNLNGSAGWRFEGVRWLLASARSGGVNSIEWKSKSLTKQLVARQFGNSQDNPSLFDEFAGNEIGEDLLFWSGEPFDMDTLIVGYSLDFVARGQELILGHSRWNPDGTSAWYWTVDLFAGQSPDEVRGNDFQHASVQPDEVPDAPVKLRRPAASQDHNTAGGRR